VPRPFFFSYAHNDARDEHLLAFLKKLNVWVRGLSGVAEDGFCDKLDIRAGEKWSDELVDELKSGAVMVCMYSPSYFQSGICGREMQVFLERRHEDVLARSGSPPASIIPVLWLPTEIPDSLPGFQYVRPESQELDGQGVRSAVAFGNDAEVEQIASKIATRVNEALQCEYKLSPLTYKPALEGLGSAFDPPLLPPTDFDVPEAKLGPDSVTCIYASSPPWNDWPFAPDMKPILHLAAAVAKGRELQLHQLMFDPAQADLSDRLKLLERGNTRMLLLVDGCRLADAQLRARLQEYDGRRIETASTLIVWPKGLAPDGSKAWVDDAFPSLSRRGPPVFFGGLQNHKQFVDAVRKSLDFLRNIVIRRPTGVPSVTPTTAYTTVPTVSVPTRRAAAAS
jgi:hypothetical protein